MFNKICDKCRRNFNAKTTYYSHQAKCQVPELEDEHIMEASNNVFNKMCNRCGRNFKAKSSNYSNCAKCQKPTLECEPYKMDTVFNKMCDRCDRIFRAKSTYYNHHAKCQGLKTLEKITYKCMECNFGARLFDTFYRHMKKIHNTDLKEEEVYDFASYKEFKHWLKEFQNETKSEFGVKSSRKNQKKVFRYFECTRSGKYTSQVNRIRAPKKTGSKKIGYNCTARISVLEETATGAVTAKVNRVHYGHDIELCHLRHFVHRSNKTRPTSTNQVKLASENQDQLDLESQDELDLDNQDELDLEEVEYVSLNEIKDEPTTDMEDDPSMDKVEIVYVNEVMMEPSTKLNSITESITDERISIYNSFLDNVEKVKSGIHKFNKKQFMQFKKISKVLQKLCEECSDEKPYQVDIKCSNKEREEEWSTNLLTWIIEDSHKN